MLSYSCHHLQTGHLSQPPSSVQIDKNQKLKGQVCTVGGQELPVFSS
jgi:hypothetical protein